MWKSVCPDGTIHTERHHYILPSRQHTQKPFPPVLFKHTSQKSPRNKVGNDLNIFRPWNQAYNARSVPAQLKQWLEIQDDEWGVLLEYTQTYQGICSAITWGAENVCRQYIFILHLHLYIYIHTYISLIFLSLFQFIQINVAPSVRSSLRHNLELISPGNTMQLIYFPSWKLNVTT